MSYGSSSFGSTSLGGAVGSLGVFFSSAEQLSAGAHRRTIEYLGGADFFEVVQTQETTSVEPQRVIRIFNHNDLGETPQLQTTVGEAFYAQSIVGAARFIVVELELLDTLSQIGINVTGREYFQ